MTVCIAAVAENGKNAVLVADRMITAKIPIAFEFQTNEVKKIYRLAKEVYLLTAGDTMNAYKVAINCQKKVGKILGKDPVSTLSVEDIAEIVRKEYQDFRRDQVVKKFLEPRGFDLNTYYGSLHKLNSSTVREIENELMDYEINVELIVAGKDEGGICHIFTITHPGVATNNDSLGYISVGSGAPHAMYFLIGSDYCKAHSLEMVKKNVLKAKKMSEKAPGVGELTTVITVPSRNGESVKNLDNI